MTLHEADARDLGAFADGSVDIALASLAIHNIMEFDYGEEARGERRKAIAEALRVLKPGG